MGGLSGLTIGDTTFPVFAGGGDVPIHILLPKSPTDNSDSGLAMLAWPNGMRYVYCTGDPGANTVTGFIPPEYMGNGSVYINDKEQCIVAAGSTGTYYLKTEVNGNSVVGDSTTGATVTFERGVAAVSGAAASSLLPNKTSILFFVNPA